MQWCYWHHETLTLIPMALQDQKCHFAPHFDHLDIGYEMVPLTMQSTSYDADAGCSGVT